MEKVLLIFCVLQLSFSAFSAHKDALCEAYNLNAANVDLTEDIRLNQVGFYPYCQKLAIVKDADEVPFYITLPDASDTLFQGVLSEEDVWEYSNELVRKADFSEFTEEGEYVLIVEGKGRSHVFRIDANVHQEVTRATLKAYYFNRASQELQPQNAGEWARPLGHPDESVAVHWSAETPGRPDGTLVSAPKGWYDAGDFGKYIVNAGISTYTLLSIYEHFPAYSGALNLNIPESGNGVPDLLDEIKFNLDWMLDMQVPEDGSVYHKLTEAGFEAVQMPHEANGQRLVIGRSTEAAFDFAAVMAQAYRVFSNYEEEFPGYAERCLEAAVRAFEWGVANPDRQFTENPAGIQTGEYKNSDINKCLTWAAMELYAATLEDSYYTNYDVLNENFTLPRWDTVNTLGLITLAHHKNNLTEVADIGFVESTIISLADKYRGYAENSAYAVPMGARAHDFSWGSNSFCANEGMILVQAYRITGDDGYINAAISAMDYLLGRNATAFSFVTGSGDKTPMDPHHRQSAADGVGDPVPGFLVGGPQDENNPDDCPWLGFETARKYSDTWCSYSTNEVTINWNAPIAYLGAALEALGGCDGDVQPITLLSLKGVLTKDNIEVHWSTANEVNNDFFIIERSDDGKVFYELGAVSGGGTIFHRKDYSYIDELPATLTVYYRLRQIDFDGKESVSKVVTVMLQEEEFYVYPNPASGTINIQLSNIIAKDIFILSPEGKKIPVNIPVNGLSCLTYDVSSLKAGIYFIQVVADNQIYTEKFAIQ